MITLNRKLKKEYTEPTNGLTSEPVKRISVRDKLLVKEVQEMNENLPATCSVHFQDPNVLSEFILTVTPDEGYWVGGKFKFSVYVTDDYNMAVRTGFSHFYPIIQILNYSFQPLILSTDCKFYCKPIY